MVRIAQNLMSERPQDYVNIIVQNVSEITENLLENSEEEQPLFI